MASAERMASFLSSAGSFLKSVNPSLLSDPPSPEEVTGKDVCFNGVNGGDDVLCKDLPDGMRGGVGSWYISPERHIVEYFVVSALTLLVIGAIMPRIVRYPSGKAGENVLRPPALIRFISVFFFGLQCTYKYAGYPGKWLSVLLPCNILWFLHAALSFYPMSSHTAHIIIQLCVGYSGLAMVALAVPDTDDCVLPFEEVFFFTHHYMLLAFPAYYIGLSGKVSLLPDKSKGETFWGNFMKWHLLSCALFGLFYFALVTPISVYSGLNLNYMLSPPPNPGDVVSGPYFRIMSIGCCSTLFFIVRLLASVGELVAGFMQSILTDRKSVV